MAIYSCLMCYFKSVCISGVFMCTQDLFFDRFVGLLADNQQATFASSMASAWLSLRLQVLSYYGIMYYVLTLRHFSIYIIHNTRVQNVIDTYRWCNNTKTNHMYIVNAVRCQILCWKRQSEDPAPPPLICQPAADP